MYRDQLTKLRERQKRRQNKETVRAIKLDRGCKLCSYRKCAGALQYHHVDRSTKSFGISDSKGTSMKRVLSEIAKCIVLCANCHAEIEDKRHPALTQAGFD